MEGVHESLNDHHRRIKDLEKRITTPSNLAKTLSKSFADLFCEVTELKVRLQALEAKEEQRARDEHERQQFLDWKNSEGLGEY